MPEMSINSGNSDRVSYIKLYQKNGLNAVFKPFLLGRGRRTWTLGTRFWRPLLYQLSYTPILISTDEIMKVSFVNLLINFNARLIISPFSRFVNTFLWNLTFWAERWFFQYLQYKCSDQITQFLWFPADFRGSLQFGNGVRRWGIQGTACRCWGCPE